MLGRNAWTGAAAVAVFALLVILAVAVPEIRLIYLAAFCLLVPGYGWARRMQPNDRGDTLAMAVVLSLCASVLVGTALAVSGLWSPLTGLAILFLIALVGLAPIPGVAPFRKEFKSRPVERPGQQVMRTQREFCWGIVAGLIAVGLVLAGCTSADMGTTPADVQIPSTVKPKVEKHPGANSEQGILLDDGFDGNTLGDSTWNTCYWWQDDGCTIKSNNGLEWYLPEQVRVSDGALHMTAERSEISASNGRDYPFASGMVTTGPPAHDMPSKLQFTYGKVEVRFQLPSGRGLWPAIWLLPASEESRPEIDMLEVTGDATDRLMMHLHPRDRSAPPIGKDHFLPEGRSLAGSWHTVSLDWSPGKLTYLLDGEEVWQVVGGQVPDEPMYLVMNLAVGGEYPGNPDKNTKFPAVFKIDRVRILGNS